MTFHAKSYAEGWLAKERERIDKGEWSPPVKKVDTYLPVTTLVAPRGYFVYILRDIDRNTLYVGRSSNVLGRLGEHMRKVERRDDIEEIDLIRCKDEADMLETEVKLVAKYRPSWNTVGITRL